MTDRTVFLFPGLGAYAPGVLAPLAASVPEVELLIREIDEAAVAAGATPVAHVLLGGDEAALSKQVEQSGDLMQMAIFTTSLAVHRALMVQGTRPYLHVGHSFGEIAALVAAEAFTLVDGIRLVTARAAALKPWEGRGTMAAIEADEHAVEHLIGFLGEPDVAIACLNSPRQTVVSGPVDAVRRVTQGAQKFGLLATDLRVPYASHHPSLKRAVDTFVALTRNIEQQPLRHPVLSPIHGRRYTDADDLHVLLAQGLVTRVNFTETIRRLHASGLTSFVEVGARRALTRSAALTVPGLTTVAPLADSTAIPPIHPTEQAATAVPAAPPPVEPEPIQPVPQARSARDQMFARIQQLYAEVLEYPLELLTEEALLEAELGVDSLKQMALLNRATELFGLSEAEAGLRVLDFPSLRHIADYVVARSLPSNGLAVAP